MGKFGSSFYQHQPSLQSSIAVSGPAIWKLKRQTNIFKLYIYNSFHKVIKNLIIFSLGMMEE